ncbi:MAG: hypothetical protein K0R24_2438 [Gammaproteobacteria bacterium]|jgi:hypothetical protein|nr:hypothetical protein [Gammaproteobacteria bacterium]
MLTQFDKHPLLAPELGENNPIFIFLKKSGKSFIPLRLTSFVVLASLLIPCYADFHDLNNQWYLKGSLGCRVTLRLPTSFSVFWEC